MEDHSVIFVGLDVSKASHSVAVADAGREGEVRFFGDIASSAESVRRMVRKLEKRGRTLHFCYEAGPTGYGLHRQIEGLGHRCSVIAPSLVPHRPGDRVKTNRRDAIKLARLLRAGELTEIWVPDAAHEALRDLVRARESAVKDRTRKRQEIRSMMLRHRRDYPRKNAWSMRYFRWLQEQTFDHPALTTVLQEMILAERHARERIERLEQAMTEAIGDWSLAPVVDALRALRGVELIGAVTFMVEVGDVRRFESPRHLMAYLGLVPSENSTGDRVRRGGITKCGNARVRRTLTESAWCYRYSARISQKKLYHQQKVSAEVRDIAWKAQSRLCARYRALVGRGKRTTVATTAIARELAGFMWAIARAMTPTT